MQRLRRCGPTVLFCRSILLASVDDTDTKWNLTVLGNTGVGVWKTSPQQLRPSKVLDTIIALVSAAFLCLSCNAHGSPALCSGG